MADTSDFRNGLCIEYNGDLYSIVSFQHVKPGKGGAFVRTKLKSLTTGKVLENTFTAGVKITTARIERKKASYLYHDKGHFYFMDLLTYESIPVPAKLIEGADYLKEGAEVEILVHQESGSLLGCELPPSTTLRVVHAEQGARGNTATKATKPAELETGAIVQVPLFIETDDLIKVDTRTGAYKERVQSTASK